MLINILWLSVAFIITVLLSWKTTAWAYYYARANSILDHPNQRSLHSEPTPRGGGLSIATLTLSGIILLWWVNMLPLESTLALFIGGGVVAVVGWLDDRSDTPAWVRALVYLLTAIWAVYWILGGILYPAWNDTWLILVSILGIAWLTNLYNFMDGSDGIAALQAISAGTMGAILLLDANETGMALLTLIIVASSTGFLIWNWPPARIFMGDVGSCLLGFLYSVIALQTFVKDTLPFGVWLILLSVFLGDASFTLVKRLAGGEKWYHAHKQHAYQRFIQLGNSHQQLNYYFVIFNMVVVYPMAYLAYQVDELQWWASVAVYGLLAGIWLTIQIKYRNFSQRKPENV